MGLEHPVALRERLEAVPQDGFLYSKVGKENCQILTESVTFLHIFLPNRRGVCCLHFYTDVRNVIFLK
jgi:hypothetical protein